MAKRAKLSLCYVDRLYGRSMYDNQKVQSFICSRLTAGAKSQLRVLILHE